MYERLWLAIASLAIFLGYIGNITAIGTCKNKSNLLLGPLLDLSGLTRTITPTDHTGCANMRSKQIRFIHPPEYQDTHSCLFIFIGAARFKNCEEASLSKTERGVVYLSCDPSRDAVNTIMDVNFLPLEERSQPTREHGAIWRVDYLNVSQTMP